MINQDLLKYIENEKAKGLSKETIHSNLLDNGWNEKDIIEAFSNIILENNHTVSDTPVIEKKWRRLKNFLRLNIKKIILTIFLIFFAPIPLFLLFAFVSQPPIKYLLGLTLVTNVLGGIFTILIFATESFFAYIIACIIDWILVKITQEKIIQFSILSILIITLITASFFDIYFSGDIGGGSKRFNIYDVFSLPD